MMRKKLKTIGQYILVVVLSLLVAILLRVFVVDFYTIPSDSMRPTLEPGDFILVNKLCYGARLYRNFDFLETGDEPETWRVPALGQVKRNDVVVFNYPRIKKKRDIEMNLSSFYVKRCIGLPGDTLAVVDGFYRVNNETGFGNMEEQQRLSEDREAHRMNGYRTRSVAPGHDWNIRNWGPVRIPSKGMTISIDSSNVRIYDSMIAYEMKAHTFKVQKNKAWLDGHCLEQYTFRQDWYFMAGDHLYNSKDSRYIGLVPGKFIVGKVVYVLSNRDRQTGEYNWSRFLKRVIGG